ncbi:MAG: carboxypeptidase-like regulatory domain-containing protein [Algoriphagus sp.]|jgi:hypothetical protein|uniref:carboxypeptidase-like regulatory domain-containing protein n=1 Tax=Algoriphagus sp. TaxID=1872435 RepID=UPI00275399E4|nr:carboxypeptidase-like regulatory domain-containing protein [Algoriphagus sp.]MDP5125587.1 carboxypeptidase-like regulatory domain-containing protein [Algoriphagus sp.]
MRLFLVFIGMLWFGFGFSQTITGTVREKGTGLPLPFANVFVNNTTIGSATDAEGRFRINGEFSTEIELVASFMGYVTEVKALSFRKKGEVQVDFQLQINESDLSEIELKAKLDKSWNREFRRFEEVFLALPDDPYHTQIKIENPWVLEFEKVKAAKGPNYLQASAAQPLKITNMALGYEIDYYLKDFRVMRTGSMFYGQVFYAKMKSGDEGKMAEWEMNREANYHSSLRHFNATLLLNLNDSIHFEVYRVLPEQLDRERTNDFREELGESILPINPDSIFRKPLGNGNFRIYTTDRLEIHHLDKPWKNDYYTNVYHAISWIQAPSGYYDVDKKGTLINPTQLVLSGYFSRQRMARILPLDFMPSLDQSLVQNQNEVLTNPAIQFNRLREKAWLMTNKPYYYPGESVWVGGKMLYQDQQISDSLSRVLHVDLINSKSEIIQSATFPIEKGKVSGGWTLLSNLVPGDYALQAYTHWNQNFGEFDQFVTPFLVMEPGFKPKAEQIEVATFQGEITVRSEATVADSLSYRVMDLKLELLDEFQNPIDGEFILSLTDSEAVSQIQGRSSLEDEMNWLDKKLPENFKSTLGFPIEYGLSVQGQFTADNKRRTAINPITIVRGDLEDFGQVMTDSLGNFWATGLIFKDTAQIAIAALDQKRRPYGRVALLPLKRPIVPLNYPRFSYTVEPNLNKNSGLDVSGEYVMLEEFVKEEVKERETMVEGNYGYGDPTQEVSGDILEKETIGQILGRLGFNWSTLKFRNFTYGERTGTPLLILDGNSLPFLEPTEFRNILEEFEPSQLESIKVYSDNIGKSIFGMAGYAGVIMIETKKGLRTGPDSDKKFNSEGFQIFAIPGFTEFPEFIKNPPSDQFLKKKPTIYWEPQGITISGAFQTNVKVPYGVKAIHIWMEGMTLDGQAFSKMIQIKF